LGATGAQSPEHTRWYVKGLSTVRARDAERSE
jgi:hypothetical protein